MKRWLNRGTSQVFGLPYAPPVPTSDHHPKPPPPDRWPWLSVDELWGFSQGGQTQPPRVPEVSTSGRYPTSEPPLEWDTIVRTGLGQAMAPGASAEPVASAAPPPPPADDCPPTTDREAWLLGQLVEARRQLEAGIDRLRAIEERLSP